MYNVLIVDDEPLFREALKVLVPWNEHEFYIVGEAFNGAEAWNFITSNHVDILITDIKMPVMDGIELLRRLYDAQMNIKVVVLSSYDDFPLVKEAFKLGSKDYILKPEMDPTHVIDVCSKLVAEIEDERTRMEQEKQRLSEHKILADQVYRNRQAIKEKFFQELIWGEGLRYHKMEDEIAQLGLRLRPYAIAIMSLYADNYESVVSSNDWQGEKELLTFAILNIMEEILDEYKIGDVFENNSREYVIVFSFTGEYGYKDALNVVAEIYDRLKDAVGKCLDIKLSSGVSDMEDGYDNLPKLYCQADEACRYRFVMGNSRIITYNDVCREQDRSLTESMHEMLHKLEIVLNGMDDGCINNIADEITIKDYRNIGIEQIDEVKKLYDMYALTITAFVNRHDMYGDIKPMLEKYNVLIKGGASLHELNKWLKETLRNICDTLKCDNHLVRKAKQYIQQHYMEDISLEEVAEYLGVSKGYLSRIFSQDSSVNFVEYLNIVRIEHAKEYMHTTTMKIYEIAEKVGYTNVEYFSRLFKRIVGKSPKEYMSKAF